MKEQSKNYDNKFAFCQSGLKLETSVFEFYGGEFSLSNDKAFSFERNCATPMGK